jgi:hypothetical protein
MYGDFVSYQLSSLLADSQHFSFVNLNWQPTVSPSPRAKHFQVGRKLRLIFRDPDFNQSDMETADL